MNSNGRLQTVIPQLIAIGMLGWAIMPTNPYGYYMVLRWVCCAIFVYLAIQANKIQLNAWVWILLVAAGVYNPIIRVHANREFWTIVNLVTIGIVVVSIFAFQRKSRTI